MSDLKVWTCEEVKIAFEAISPDDDIGRMDLRTNPGVTNHLKECPSCSEWVTNFLRSFIHA